LGHFTTKTVASRALRLAGALAFALVLGGCGTGVELEGKVFDYMGVSGDRSQADVQMSQRAPLLVPPNVKALPQPGTNAAAVTARQDWPDDPELVRKRIAKQEKAKEAEIQAANDPINPYAGKPTLLDKLFGGSDTELVPVAAVPEPDASDRQPGAAAQQASAPKGLTPHVSQVPLPDQQIQPATPKSYGQVSNPKGDNAGW
jgi:hypothetical protein